MQQLVFSRVVSRCGAYRPLSFSSLSCRTFSHSFRPHGKAHSRRASDSFDSLPPPQAYPPAQLSRALSLELQSPAQLFPGMVIHWFPGHMHKAREELTRQLEKCQLIVEIRDARIPFSSANPDFDELLKGKKKILVFSKVDLAHPNTRKIVQPYYSRLGVPSLFLSGSHPQQVQRLLFPLIEEHVVRKFKTVPPVICIVGYPNVGKSTIINSMKPREEDKDKQKQKTKGGEAKVGATPGITRDISGFLVRSSPPLFVLDTPGIMIPSFDQTERGIETALKLSVTGCISDHVVGDEVLARYILYSLNRSGQLAYVKLLGLAGPTNHLHVILSAIAHPPKASKKNTNSADADADSQEKASDASIGQLRNIRVNTHKSGILRQWYEMKGLDYRNPQDSPLAAQAAVSSEESTLASKKFIHLFRSGKLGRVTLDVEIMNSQNNNQQTA